MLLHSNLWFLNNILRPATIGIRLLFIPILGIIVISLQLILHFLCKMFLDLSIHQHFHGCIWITGIMFDTFNNFFLVISIFHTHFFQHVRKLLYLLKLCIIKSILLLILMTTSSGTTTIFLVIILAFLTTKPIHFSNQFYYQQLFLIYL